MGLSVQHLLLLSVIVATVSAHNITDILSTHPDYTDFNRFLTQTKIVDEINTRQTITVLVLPNSIFSPVATSHPLSVIKKVLSLHVFLDYFDEKKLHQISNGTELTTTLFQTTGTAENYTGLVNITHFKDGKVAFGSAAPNSTLDSFYTKSVKQIPYKISVIEISAPIIAPGILTAPPPLSDLNLTTLLENRGCKTFSSLILSSGVMKTFQSIADKGLTIFVPTDEGFKSKDVPDLKNLTSDEVVTLLHYHATASYLPFGSLRIFKGPISTLASNGTGKFGITVSVISGSVKLLTGVNAARVAENILDSPPLSIFTIDKVLIPKDSLGKAPAPAPAHAPTPGHSPAPGHDAHSPDTASPPSPSGTTPEVAPMSPPADEAGHGSEKAAGFAVEAGAALSLVAFVISAIFMH